MKKFKIFVLAILLLTVVVGCGKSSNLKSISYSKLNKMLENEETFFFVVTKDGCSHCEAFVPVVEEVLKEYDLVGYNLNISEMNDSDYEEFYNTYNVTGTPTTIFISKGKETSLLQRIDGEVSKEKLISKLKANNYIEK